MVAGKSPAEVRRVRVAHLEGAGFDGLAAVGQEPGRAFSAQAEDGTSHDDLSGTVMQGCSVWKNNRVLTFNPSWESAFEMNEFPWCENDVQDTRSTTEVTGSNPVSNS